MPKPILSEAEISALIQAVLVRFGEPLEQGKHCEILRDDILKTTGNQIGISSLKRLFGFMTRTTNFSSHTLEVLSRYADYASLKAFLSANSNGNTQQLFAETSGKTIKFIKSRRSGEYISHKGLTDLTLEIQDFLASEKPAFAIVGEGGSGKSQFLADFCTNNPAENILFMESRSFQRQLANQDISTFLDKISPDLKVLVLDAIEETIYNFHELQQFFQELTNWLLSDNKKRKLLISVRTFTWARLTETFRNEAEQQLWFNDLSRTENFPAIPLLTLKNKFPELDPAVLELLQKPIFLHIYSKTQSREITTELTLLESFFRAIYESAQGYGKSEILFEFLRLSHYSTKENYALKKDIDSLLNKHKRAYLELLSAGILQEEKIFSNGLRPKFLIRIGHEVLLDFLILESILDTANGNLVLAANYIQQNYSGEKCYNLLHLLASHGLHNSDPGLVKLTAIPDDYFTRRAITHQIGKYVRNHPSLQKLFFPSSLKDETVRKNYFERIVDEPNIDGYYGEALKEYLKIVTSPQDKLFAYCLLYIGAYRNNDEAEMENWFEKVESIEPDLSIHSFVLGRAYKVKMLEKFRKTGTYGKKLLAEISEILKVVTNDTETFNRVHFAGFEYNILHAEFLTGSYHFTKELLEKINNSEKKEQFADLLNKEFDLSLFRTRFEEITEQKPVDYKSFEQPLEKMIPWEREISADYLRYADSGKRSYAEFLK